MKSKNILLALVPLFLMGQIGFVLAKEKSNSVESATWWQRMGQALHKENVDPAMFNEAELTQHFNCTIKFKKTELFNQKKYK